MVLSREDLFKSGGAKKGVAVTMTEPVYDCPSLNEAAAGGDFMLQNLPSIVCGHALLQGENSNADIAVLDMCAAPGGKTTHLATMLAAGGGGGLVVALDKSRNKVSQIMANAERQGLKNVRAHAQDASKCVKEGTAKDKIIGTLSPPFDPETFSKILLDAPCSALGKRPKSLSVTYLGSHFVPPRIAGQRPQFLNAISLCDLDSFPRIQRKLFVEAVRLLSIGGEVVYSTCTVTKEENEEIVVWALKKFAGVLEIVSFEPAGLGSPGLEVPGLEKEAAEKARRFFIGKEVEDGEDTIGFFIAKFRRIS
jgi:16S rRNA C967 or C1407 C5-methylase (RsmB/RsmF family)